ncbi:MAG: VCBS repeat-containing protein [Myxococcales bacterium]|nr:VCBS repeat-containing protein [Myxococcales bacterium]
MKAIWSCCTAVLEVSLSRRRPGAGIRVPALVVLWTLGSLACGSIDPAEDRRPDGGLDAGDEPEVRDSGFDNPSPPDTPDASVCPKANLCAGGQLCCDDDEECVDQVMCLPVCEGLRCGASGKLCCDDDQVCLTGAVCARACEEDETVCGTDLDTCCDTDQVCLANTCVTPGISCRDDFDCLGGGLFCEATIGQCLPTPEGQEACQVRPEFERVALEEEWHWPGVMIEGELYENVMATPMVGDVSGDGTPDVVVPAYPGSRLNEAVLVAISGDDGQLLWYVTGSERPFSQIPVALANFDDDASLEIFYQLASGPFRLLDGDGVTELQRRDAPKERREAPAVADLDGDGTPDVVVGCDAFNGHAIGDPTRDFFAHGTCSTGARGASAIANLDDDPEPEVTSGGVAYNIDGSSLWTSTGEHGFPAVADLNADGKPEVITIGQGKIVVRAGADGSVLVGAGGSWADGDFLIPGSGTGGAPTVADFDGDGLPEIAAAGQASYVVYDPDCLDPAPRSDGDCTRSDPAAPEFTLWATPTQDLSSSVTGSSVFDFQGDGKAEVIYNDECFLHIYNGSDGTEPLDEVVPNSSRTDYEYPLVVDVDRDGNSEIVVPANRDQAVDRDGCPAKYAEALDVDVEDLPDEIRAGTAGIFVFGDPFDRWVGTRPIWNQFTYHVTNVTNDGDIPEAERDNWTDQDLNNYRQNVQGEGVFNAPNLTVTLTVVTRCLDRSLSLVAVVSNAGSRGVPAGVHVDFFQTQPGDRMHVGTVMTEDALLPGGSERMSVTVEDIPEQAELSFEVVVDGEDAASGIVIECEEDDNRAVGDGECIVLGPG